MTDRGRHIYNYRENTKTYVDNDKMLEKVVVSQHWNLFLLPISLI